MEIYLDNAATTKPCPAAVAAVMEALTENWGNPSAVHQLGLRAEKAVKQARQQVAAVLGISRAGAYELVHSEDFPTLKIGSRIVVPKDKLREWIDANTAQK